MKKLMLIIFILFVSCAVIQAAESVIPEYISVEKTNTYGLYQAPNEMIIYQEPDDTSNVLKNISWIGSVLSDTIEAKNLFMVYIPDKNLGLLEVTDETEDWVQIIYDNKENLKGWIKKDDPYRFMSWIMFYNMYGKKYGLKLLKEAPPQAKDIHVATDDTSKTVSIINMPQKINLTAIKGNWALVSVFDIDKTPKTGFVRWRSDNGIKYYFPDIK